MTSQRQQLTLNLNPVFDALEKPLALVEDPDRRRQAQLLLENSRVHQEKAILNLVSQLVEGLNEAGIAQCSLEVRGEEYVVNLDRDVPDSEPVFDASEEIERVTIRMPRRLKELIDQVAERGGRSTNTWYVRTLARSVAHQMRDHGFAFARGADQGWGWRGRGRRRGGRGGGVSGAGDSAD